MTTLLVTARRKQSVAEVRAVLAAQAEHRTEIDAIAVLERLDDGRLVADVALFDLAVAEDATKVADLTGWLAQFGSAGDRPPGHPPDGGGRAVGRRPRLLLVVDDEDRPLGRILADDVLDTLLPESGRLHFRRFLQ